MDKNVSSVDLDELRKAREELNKEIGVENDPNMYKDYNPNRENSASNVAESSETRASETTDEVFLGKENQELESEDSVNHIVLENSKSSYPEDEAKFEDGYSESSKPKIQEDSHSKAEENLDKYDDIFSAFEVKENVHHDAGEKLDFKKLEDSSQRTTNIQKIEEELMSSVSEETSDETESSSESAGESKFETIDNVDELESMLDKLLDELDSDDIEEILHKPSGVSEEENLDEKTSSQDDISSAYLASIDIEPKLEQEVKEETKKPSELDILLNESEDERTELEVNEDKSEIKEEKLIDNRLERLMKGTNFSSENSELKTEEEKESELDESIEEDVSLIDKEEPTADEILENEESVNVETDEESKDSDITIEEDEEIDVEETQEIEEINVEPEPVVKKPRIVSETIESYDASKAKPSFGSKKMENSSFDGETEIITDYSQLREILQRELRESELESKERIEDDDGVKYALIEEFKFINEIATDEFKNSDKFSYIMGKNEKGELVYGNFREHFNLAVFGKNDEIINSFLNSMVLSLCLKNSTSDINFVMLDSDINSAFEVYNKSSYLYFNRIAKTNKEILDTLIEVTKELDLRYEKLAEAGMNNVEQFNDMAKETSTTPIPHLIVVFNNYTSASQATYFDKINACLYQILKYGRIVGIYAVVTAMLPINSNEINYNLSSRLSFKSDQDSKYTVGVEGTHKLPDENDAIYFNISKNTTEHIKTATVTDTELDLIIKELEE